MPQAVIHCFVDASQIGLWSCYSVYCPTGPSVICSAKIRVAPPKQLTLPWLELMAALIATRLTCFA